mmetsp:Transcript_46019/g.107301  ORF Transcript_46019/g.107301 Transcript_46019/m.107301 type:complete len:393 (-) Transcript_46019:666-1844(-)
MRRPGSSRLLEEEIFLRERQYLGGLTRELFAVGPHLEGLGVDGDVGRRVVVDHVFLADRPCAAHRLNAFREAVLALDIRCHCRAGDEGDRRAPDGAAKCAEHATHQNRLRRRDGSVRVAHLRPRDGPALDHHLRLGAEQLRLPQHHVRELAHLQGADEVRHAVRECRIHRVLGDVPLDARVVVARSFVFGQRAALLLHLIRRLPGARHHLTHAPHRLGVGRHDRDGAEIVQDVLRRDGLAADTTLGEGDVLGDVLVEVVADHEHVQVLVDGVDGEGTRRVGRRRQHVRQPAHLDDVGRVPAAGALRVVCVDRPPADRRERVVDVAGLVERVGVDGDGDVVLVGEGEARVDGGGGRAPVLVQLEAGGARLDHLDQPAGVRGVALAGEAEVEGQ